MTDPILNQKEIQALVRQQGQKGQKKLSGFWTGETHPYDFWGAALNKDEKIQLATKLHKTAAKYMTNNLSELLDQNLEVTFDRHEMGTAADFLTKVNFDERVIQLWMDDSNGIEGLFDIERGLFFKLYSLFLGGKMQSAKEGRLTALEQSFYERFLGPVSESLQSVWRGKGNWRFSISRYLELQEDLTSLGWSFDCFQAQFKIKVGEAEEGRFNILFPKEILNFLGDGDLSAADTRQAQNDKHWMQAVLHAIAHKSLDVQVTLGHVRLPVNQVLKLKAGDEHALKVSDKGYQVFIDGRPKFIATLGALDDRRAIKVI